MSQFQQSWRYHIGNTLFFQTSLTCSSWHFSTLRILKQQTIFPFYHQRLNWQYVCHTQVHLWTWVVPNLQTHFIWLSQLFRQCSWKIFIHNHHLGKFETSKIFISYSYLFFHYYFLNFQIQTALSVSIYASPLIMTWLYRRDFFTSEGLAYLTKLGFGITLVYIFAFYVRGIGRVFNPVYRQFIDVHTRCMQNLSPENKVCALKLNNLRTK